MEHQIWILGHGPVIIHSQFVRDIPRSKNRFRLNGFILPDNPFLSSSLLYDTCGIHYFQYTKYMNQTMGNLLMSHLQRIYANVIVPCQDTYRIDATYTQEKKEISCQLIVRIMTDDLRTIHRIHCRCTYNILTDKVLNKIKLL